MRAGWTLQPIVSGPGPADAAIPFVPDEKAYNRYRKSAGWQKIRARILGMARGRCRCCGKAADQVHHRDYRPRVLKGDDLGALVAICTFCHRKVHFADDGRRRVSWDESERVLGELVASHAAGA